MSKQIAHPLEHNAEARAYYEALTRRASKSGVCTWREVVEQLTGSLPTYAARKHKAREKAAVKAIQH
ncbi:MULTISPECIES: hypothetical protein [unclassified Caballeronia]|uniref:hypothetical protein n=1 Tax=unclassified Caballeronia TaxID=2646786 RepID=UPI0028583686|nr:MULTISPECIES: hypothetical protein [unclassified Caballeronia]MDR5771801.1 hypothetical protein [Caballeronia sp. LZ002]MDR5847236.1 hypothetical protein [Caballeronia sp. LZ003]